MLIFPKANPWTTMVFLMITEPPAQGSFLLEKFGKNWMGLTLRHIMLK